jgi:hypothetical protein
LITVKGSFAFTHSPNLLTFVANFQNNYNFIVSRQALNWSPCTGAPPVCAPGIAVCESDNWHCVNPGNPTCSGPVSWTVGGNICSGVINPAILHDTTTVVTNTAALFSGLATYLCQNGSALLQATPAPTCVASPVNGLCGPANGNSYPDSASVTAAGLCSAGSPTALAGTGPWTWTCNGSNGGASSPPCQANIQQCRALILAWTVGTESCLGPAPLTNSGNNAAITATIGAGSATFACVGSTWQTTPLAFPAPTCVGRPTRTWVNSDPCGDFFGFNLEAIHLCDINACVHGESVGAACIPPPIQVYCGGIVYNCL